MVDVEVVLVIVVSTPTIAAEDSDVLPMSFVAIAVMHAPAATGGMATKATSLRAKMVKVGAKVVAHGRYLVFQMVAVAVPRELFLRILDRIDALRHAAWPAVDSSDSPGSGTSGAEVRPGSARRLPAVRCSGVATPGRGAPAGSPA